MWQLNLLTKSWVKGSRALPIFLRVGLGVVLQSLSPVDCEGIGTPYSGGRLLDRRGEVHPALIGLLGYLRVDHDGTPAGINIAMQRHFLRRIGTERWDGQSKALRAGIDRSQVLEWLDQLDLVKTWPVEPLTIDYFLVFGGTYTRCRSRWLDFCEQYGQGGLQCREVVLLGGNRALRTVEKADMEAVIGEKKFNAWRKNFPGELTETSIWYFLLRYETSPSVLSRLKIGDNLWIIDDHQYGKRPTTNSTLHAWQRCPWVPGHCHGNVEKPYGVRMKKTLLNFLYQQPSGQQWYVTWNSASASPSLPLPVYLDCLARAFYEEWKLLNIDAKSSEQGF